MRGRPKTPPGTPCPQGHNEGRTKGNRCIVCRRERAQQWRDANPDKVRARRLRWDAKNAERLSDLNRAWKEHNRDSTRSRYHGLTYGEMRLRLALQGGVCAICHQGEPDVKRWHGDHDHDTGAFRGVLCHKCNVGIGMLADQEERCRAAADYLSAHRQLQALL